MAEKEQEDNKGYDLYKPLKMEETDISYTTNKTLVDAGIIVCAYCGAAISIDDVDCGGCGQEFTYIYKNKLHKKSKLWKSV